MRWACVVLGLGGMACQSSIGEVVSDFSLIDTNPTSPTAGREVSPRDHLGQVSAWYFGHAT